VESKTPARRARTSSRMEEYWEWRSTEGDGMGVVSCQLVSCQLGRSLRSLRGLEIREVECERGSRADRGDVIVRQSGDSGLSRCWLTVAI